MRKYINFTAPVLFTLAIIAAITLIAQTGSSDKIQRSVIDQGGKPSQSAQYRLSDVIGQSSPVGKGATTNYIVSSGFLGSEKSTVTTLNGAEAPDIPAAFKLFPNYPNPFNPTTIIEYEVPTPCRIRLVIYDLLGHQIKTLADTRQPAGHFQIIWDGTNDQSLPVAAGVYFCRMTAGDYVKIIKLALVK
jgi:hypothetical protein